MRKAVATTSTTLNDEKPSGDLNSFKQHHGMNHYKNSNSRDISNTSLTWTRKKKDDQQLQSSTQPSSVEQRHSHEVFTKKSLSLSSKVDCAKALRHCITNQAKSRSWKRTNSKNDELCQQTQIIGENSQQQPSKEELVSQQQWPALHSVNVRKVGPNKLVSVTKSNCSRQNIPNNMSINKKKGSNSIHHHNQHYDNMQQAWNCSSPTNALHYSQQHHQQGLSKSKKRLYPHQQQQKPLVEVKRIRLNPVQQQLSPSSFSFSTSTVNYERSRRDDTFICPAAANKSVSAQSSTSSLQISKKEQGIERKDNDGHNTKATPMRILQVNHHNTNAAEVTKVISTLDDKQHDDSAKHSSLKNDASIVNRQTIFLSPTTASDTRKKFIKSTSTISGTQPFSPFTSAKRIEKVEENSNAELRLTDFCYRTVPNRKLLKKQSIGVTANKVLFPASATKRHQSNSDTTSKTTKNAARPIMGLVRVRPPSPSNNSSLNQKNEDNSNIHNEKQAKKSWVRSNRDGIDSSTKSFQGNNAPKTWKRQSTTAGDNKSNTTFISQKNVIASLSTTQCHLQSKNNNANHAMKKKKRNAVVVCPTIRRSIKCTDINCRYRHDLTKEMITWHCKHFQFQKCRFNDGTCPYLHVKLGRNAKDCANFRDFGFCVKGTACDSWHL